MAPPNLFSSMSCSDMFEIWADIFNHFWSVIVQCTTPRPNTTCSTPRYIKSRPLKRQVPSKTIPQIEEMALFADLSQPVADEDFAGRDPRWISTKKKRKILNRARTWQYPTEIRDSINKRLAAQGYLDHNPAAPGEPLVYQDPLPIDRYRPRYITAEVRGRIHHTSTMMVVDSGSSQTIVSSAFGEQHLRECKRYRYDGNPVSTADNGSVEPDGIVMAEIAVGSSMIVVPMVVFPKLPVSVLLGTDWLHRTGARIDFGLQTITFADSATPTGCRVIHHHTAAPLKVLHTTVLPPQSGTWVKVTTPSHHTFTAIPSAVVGVSAD